MLNYFPRFFAWKSIGLFLIAIVVSNLIFFGDFLPIIWWIFGLAEVLFFFYFSHDLSKKWQDLHPKVFVNRLFVFSLIFRLIWVIFSFFFYQIQTGKPFEYSTGDAMGYHNEAIWIIDLISNGQLNVFFESKSGRYSDMGYTLYLAGQYMLTDGSIIIARIIKAVLGAFTAVFIYKLACSIFGESVGRMAGVFTMLMPNLIIYTGLHVKEVEMVFLVAVFMERADFMIRNRSFTFWPIIVTSVVAILLFTFRTVLGISALFALLSTFLFSTNKILGMGKRFIFVIWIVLAILFLAGGSISNEVEEVWENRNITQEQSLKWRAEREGGNKFADQIGKSVFLPLIFTIPFPTIIHSPTQENQMLIAGGNYVKNVLSIFVLFSLFLLFKERKWRDHALLIFFTIGYLITVALSAFAHSERFHQPVLPFLMIFAAYGIANATNRTKNYFFWGSVVMFVAIIGWSWFKLAGKGLL